MLLNLETNRIIKSVYDSQIFISCPFPLPAENPFYNIQAIEVGFLNRMPNRNCPTFILSCATKPMKRTSQFVRTTKATSNGRRRRRDLFYWLLFLITSRVSHGTCSNSQKLILEPLLLYS